MAPQRQLSPQSVWDVPAVLAAFDEAGIKSLHASRMWNHLARHPGSTWNDVSDFPRAAVKLLDQYFAMFTTKVTQAQHSSDGETTKLLIELQDGMQIESVIMFYDSNTSGRHTGPQASPPARHSLRRAAAPGHSPRAQTVRPHATACRLVPTQDTHSLADRFRTDPAAVAAGVVAAEEDEEAEDVFQDALEEEGPPCSSGASATSNSAALPTGSVVGGKSHTRATLCVSSQVGCQMGCTFCATGTMGLKGNLTCGEIIEQLVHARQHRNIRNIVFMGMGEPLNNYDQVRAAVATMTDSQFFRLRRKHVTVSTVGIIPRIKQLAEDLPGVSLALSLHAPTQELRATIVPSARAYKLDKLMEAVRQYQKDSNQKVFVEYVVLAGVNDGLAQAHELGALLQGTSMLCNLIPWNPVYSPDGPAFAAPSQQQLTEFQKIVRYEYNVFCTVRQEKGQDISGACGQLVVQNGGALGGKKSCSSEAKLGDIEELLPKARLA
ncbi:MAG: hypothetical protein WDW36_000669 [Sanguina aurantia]